MASYVWFGGKKYFRVPVTWQGWAVFIIYMLYLVFAWQRIAGEYPSWTYRFNWFGQEWLAVTIILVCVIAVTSEKEAKKKA